MANTDIAETPTDTIVASSLPPLSPSRLEAWDRCPLAYRFEYIDRLPRPQADEYPLLLGLACHALLEAYVREALARGSPPGAQALGALGQALHCRGAVPAATASLYREAAAMLTPWIGRSTLALDRVAGVELALAMTWDGRAVGWRDPAVGIRGRLDLLVVENRAATIQDWKSGWVAESEESLETAWAPGLYAGLLWAAAPRLDSISVEYHYVRTGQVSRVRVARDMAAETLAWARTTATMIGESSARVGSDPDAFPPRPGKACSTCPWVNRCPAGQAALEATGDDALCDEAEARRLAALLLAGEATLSRLRDRLKSYLETREPIVVNDFELGFFPTKGRYPAQAVARVLEARGGSPLEAMHVDARALARLFRRHSELEAELEPSREAGPAWFGHRKSEVRRGRARVAAPARDQHYKAGADEDLQDA
jgi:putative RecB family exonuclease